MATLNKRPKNLPVGTSRRPDAKKRSSTGETKKTRSTGRFIDVKIRIPADEYARGLPYFDEPKYLAKFILDSYRERVNRAEANNKAARLRILAGNMDLLAPIVNEMIAQGRLKFPKEQRSDV